MRKDRLCLRDICSAISAIQEFVDEMTFDEFCEDEKTQSAVIRKFEIMGEATKNLPETVREEHPDLPWSEMAGMRDRLIHGYFKIDQKLVWQTIQQELPPLKQQVRDVLHDLPDE